MSNARFAHTRDTCRLCKSRELWRAIPLSPLPVASPNVGTGSKVVDTAPADVWQCRCCGFLQLCTIVNSEFQYRNFRYFTGLSVGLREHFAQLIQSLAAEGRIGRGKFVVDIGSNDGSLLRLAKDQGARVLGIDPAEKLAKSASEAGIPTLADFFTPALGMKIAHEHGQADVVISNNTVANIDDLDDFFAGIEALIALDGLLVIETQYAPDVVQQTLLDVIYHEHVSYFAVAPMRRFLEARGFVLADAVRIAPKGGSIRFLARRRGAGGGISESVDELIAAEEAAGLYGPDAFRGFNERVGVLGQHLRARLAASRARTGRALAYGGSVGCAALVQYFSLGAHIDAIFDDNPLTNYIRTQAGELPILTGRQLHNEAPTDVAVLAWRYAQRIAAGHAEFRSRGGRFYRALPDLAWVDEFAA